MLLKEGGKEAISGYTWVSVALAGLATVKHLAEVQDFFKGKVNEVSYIYWKHPRCLEVFDLTFSSLSRLCTSSRWM